MSRKRVDNGMNGLRLYALVKALLMSSAMNLSNQCIGPVVNMTVEYHTCGQIELTQIARNKLALNGRSLPALTLFRKEWWCLRGTIVNIYNY